MQYRNNASFILASCCCHAYACILHVFAFLALVSLVRTRLKEFCSLSGEELSSVPPSPNDIRKLSKDYTAVAEDTRQDENHVDYITPDEVSAAMLLLVAERSGDTCHKETHEAVSTRDGIQQVESSRRLSSSDAKKRDGSPRQPTRRSASDVSSNKRLEEYHKWKVSGCKGDPPAKLKISQ